MEVSLTNLANKIKYHVNFMKELSYNSALLVENLESKFIANQLFSNNHIDDIPVIYENVDKPAAANTCIEFKSAPWVSTIHSIIAPMFKNKNSNDINNLYYRIKEKNSQASFFDQTWGDISIWSEETPAKYRFRKMDFHLKINTVIPSHYANSQYIDILLDVIAERNSEYMLDLCTGSGCIGLSCLNESPSLKRLLVSDISEHALSSVDETIKNAPLNGKTAESIFSHAFDEMPADARFDLITANPPHQDRVTPSITDRAGGDPGWSFHKSLFTGLHKRLTHSGLAVILENGRPNYSSANMFHEMIRQCSDKIELFDTQWIPGTEWYLIYLRAVRP